MRGSKPATKGIRLCILLSFLGGAASFAQIAAQDAAGHPIGPRDLLVVRVIEDESLNTEQRVSAEGTIEVPHIGAIDIQGLTVGQAQRRLETALERYLRRATVTVEVKEFRFRPISVLGAVTKPGYLPYSGRWTLLEALTEAGGVAEGHGGKVLVVRRAENGLTDQLTIDLDELVYQADPALNIPLQPRDLVNVPPAVNITVNCVGAVNSPGPIRFRSTEQITLLAAIGRAGGLSDRAGGRIILRRQGEEEIVVKYKALLSGNGQDLVLREGDVIVVKESFL